MKKNRNFKFNDCHEQSEILGSKYPMSLNLTVIMTDLSFMNFLFRYKFDHNSNKKNYFLFFFGKVQTLKVCAINQIKPFLIQS